VVSLIHELNLDVDLTGSVNLVDARVRTIILVSDCARNINGGSLISRLSLDNDGEFIESRSTVFTVVVSGLNVEFDGLANLHVGEETGTEGQGLGGTGVQEELEVTSGGSEILVAYHKLNLSLFRSMDGKVRRLAVHFSIANTNTGNKKGVLVWDGGNVLAAGEVNLGVVILEANTLDDESDTTRHLGELRLNAGNGIRRSDNLGYVKNVKIV
jgi:hypothetical protein